MSFSFGSTAPATAAAPAFGAATAPTAGFGFGTQPAAAPAATTGFGFGTSTAAPTAFGTAAATAAPAATTGLGLGGLTGFGFGQTTQQPAATNAFGSTGGFAFGSSAPAAAQPAATPQPQQPPPQQQQQAQYANSIEARVTAIKNAYSPTSPDCRFQTVFYNKVEPNTIPQYVRPPVANVRLWEAAVKNNPDPTQLVPSLAVGFEDLRKRISEQDKAAAAFNATLASMSASLESMVHGHEASTASAMVQLQRVHAQQSHRLLQLVNRVECARSKDVLPRLPAELEFEHKLHVLERRITQPQPLSQKIAELAAMVKLMEAKSDGMSVPSATGSADVDSWLQPDDPSAQQLFQFMQTQRIALEHVTAMIKQDQRDLQTIQQITSQTNANI